MYKTLVHYAVTVNQREALLAGAKQCLAQKGYGKTTARDITEASGANLGSIGYHFGSKDRLLNTAAVELTSEWGDAVEAAAREASGQNPAERLANLVFVLASRIPGAWHLQSAGLQALAHAEFDDDLRRQMTATLVAARCELAALVLGRNDVTPGSDEEQGVGFVVYSVVTGLVAQALVDPTTIESPDTVRRAVLALLGGKDYGKG